MPSPRNKPSAVRTSLRFEPPTLEEAIYAAQGLTDDIDGQAEIAARLMGLPEPAVGSRNPEGTSAQARSPVDPSSDRSSRPTDRSGRAQSTPRADPLGNNVDQLIASRPARFIRRSVQRAAWAAP